MTNVLRPRFSLLTILLVMALAACAITIWQLWRELVPLREEVRGYRTELGKLSIDDPTSVQGIQVPTREEGWKWRVYFPPGSDCTLRCYHGMIPAGVDAPQRSDLASMDFGPGGYLVSMGGTFHGEKIIQARLKEIDGKWVLQTSVDGGRWSDIRLDGEFAEYLSNPRGGEFWTSNLNSNEQTAFATGERIFLLKRRRPEVTEMPDGGTLSREPPGPAPGVAVWIQQE